MIYVKEEIIKKVVIDENLPLGINNYCPYDEKNKRKEIAILIKNIKKNYPDFEEKTLKAIEKSNLW